jgi:hypothetical protein
MKPIYDFEHTEPFDMFKSKLIVTVEEWAPGCPKLDDEGRRQLLCMGMLGTHDVCHRYQPATKITTA